MSLSQALNQFAQNLGRYLETKELVCGRLAVFISNRRRSPDIKYGCVSMLPLCGDVSGVSNSDMVRPYEHMYGLCRPPKHGCD